MTTAQPGNSSSAFSSDDKRLDVEVVGRLVEQQQVAALLERQRQVEPVALTAGQHAGRLLLVRALEAERGDVGPRGHLDVADLDPVEAVGDDLPQRSSSGRCRRGSGRRRRSCTVSPTLISPESGFSSPMIILNSVVLPTPFGPMTPTMPLRGSVNDRSSMSTRSSKPLVRCVGLDDDAAQPRARRDLDLLEVELAGLVGLGGHLLVAVEAGLGSWSAGPWRWTAPTRARRVSRFCALDVLLALDLQPRRPWSRGRSSSCPRTGRRGRGRARGSTAATLSRKYRSWVTATTVPGYFSRCCSSHSTLSASRWLVGSSSSSRSGCLQQQLAQRDAALLATGEHRHVGVRRRAAQRVHRLLELGVEVPGVAVVDLLLQLAHLGAAARRSRRPARPSLRRSR